MLQLLDWPSDGPLAGFMLVMAGLLVLLVALPRIRTCAVLARMLPSVILWHTVVFLYVAFWMIPYYAATGIDCGSYHSSGVTLAPMIRAGDWANIPVGLGGAAMNLLTALVYTPFGANAYGMMFLSAVLGLCGCLYFCLAFSLWVEPALVRKYSTIILFLPSIATWTGIFGKDSWMALGLGLSAFGYSSMLKGRGKGQYHFLGGMALVTAIRPHIAVTLAAATAISYIWGLTRSSKGSILGKIQKVALLIAMFAFLGAVARGFLGLTELSVDSLVEYGQTKGEANQGGGSGVQGTAVHGVTGTILGFPAGIVRVLVQPFPWEVHNINSGLAAAENIFLFGFIVSHLGRLRKLFRGLVREPYVLFSFILACGMLLMFSLLLNLGTLSRERVQLFPFLFAPLVASEAVRKRSGVALAPPPLRYSPGRLHPAFRPIVPSMSDTRPL